MFVDITRFSSDCCDVASFFEYAVLSPVMVSTCCDSRWNRAMDAAASNNPTVRLYSDLCVTVSVLDNESGRSSIISTVIEIIKTLSTLRAVSLLISHGLREAPLLYILDCEFSFHLLSPTFLLELTKYREQKNPRRRNLRISLVQRLGAC